MSGVQMSSFVSRPMIMWLPCVTHSCRIGHRSVQNVLWGCSRLSSVFSSWYHQCCCSTDRCLFSDLHSQYPASIHIIRSFSPGRSSSRIFPGPSSLVSCRLCGVLPCCGWVLPPLPVGTDLHGGPFGCVRLISVMPCTTCTFVPAVIVMVGFYARPRCFPLWQRCQYFFI